MQPSLPPPILYVAPRQRAARRRQFSGEPASMPRRRRASRHSAPTSRSIFLRYDRIVLASCGSALRCRQEKQSTIAVRRTSGRSISRACQTVRARGGRSRTPCLAAADPNQLSVRIYEVHRPRPAGPCRSRGGPVFSGWRGSRPAPPVCRRGRVRVNAMQRIIMSSLVASSSSINSGTAEGPRSVISFSVRSHGSSNAAGRES